MQAIFFLALFSMLMSIMAAIISNSTNISSTGLTIQREEITRDYFQRLAKVITEEITPTYLTAQPKRTGVTYTTVEDYVESREELKALTVSSVANNFTDAWNRPVVARWGTFNTSILSGSNGTAVTVPVTGFLFVSTGVDGTLSSATVVPTTITDIQDIYGVTAGGDDIVFAFDNKNAQRQNLELIQQYLGRVASTAVAEVEPRLGQRQKELLQYFQTQLNAGGTPDIEKLKLENDLLGSEVDGRPAQPFLLQNTPDARAQVGANPYYDFLERTLPESNGKFVVTSSLPTPTYSNSPITFILTNDSTTPTAWGTSTAPLVIRVTADIRTSNIN